VKATTEKLQQSERAMLDQEEIGQQQKLLETHRRTLAHYIKQQAMLKFLAPPGVTNGMHLVLATFMKWSPK